MVDRVLGIPARPVLVVDAVELGRLVDTVGGLGVAEERLDRSDMIHRHLHLPLPITFHAADLARAGYRSRGTLQGPGNGVRSRSMR
jgi:hypothetical protein